ncbi:MAG: aminotransferase class V-fold PLP-dependent enzyme, partial [Clostridia bacterium]|nr:aminotransferase class V-fold PLP-dependent enzyme [Clostridia bacterium]
TNCTAVFSQNCTTALNLAILGTARRKGHVITTVTEHNSVLRPLAQLQRRGIVDVSVVRPQENGQIHPQSLINALRPNTYMVAINHTSNVTGTMQQVGKLSRAVKQVKDDVLILCDCAQAVGYTLVDMTKDRLDMVAFPTHKGLHGIQGCGVLVFDTSKPPRPVVYGGTGSESNSIFQPTSLPEGLESDTLNMPAILVANAAVSWWVKGFEEGSRHIKSLQKRLLDGLKSIPSATIYSQPNDNGIVAFNVASLDSGVVGDVLSQRYGICTRTGLHCAPLMHQHLGTLSTGVVRASLAFDSKAQEVDALLEAVDSIARAN